MKTVNLDEMKKDYDWIQAFYVSLYNSYYCYSYCQEDDPEKFDLSPIVRVVSADPGENDSKNWVAIVELNGEKWAKNYKFAVMRAGCDFTGWDCQAGGNIEFYNSVEECLSDLTLTKEEKERLEI